MPSSMRLQLAPVVPPPYHQDLHRLLRHTNRSSAAALAPSNSRVLHTRSVAELLTWANPEGRAEDISKRRSRGEGVRL